MLHQSKKTQDRKNKDKHHEGSLPVLVVVFAAQGLWGMGITLMDGADAAWIADEIGVEQAAPIYLRASQIGSLASFLGIAVSAGLVNVSLNLPIVVGGSLFIALSGVLALIMPERRFTPAPRDGRSAFQQMGHTLRAGIRLVRLRPVLLTSTCLTKNLPPLCWGAPLLPSLFREDDQVFVLLP